MSNPKRTRSQLALPDVLLHLPLARSPLKDARTALRNQPQPILKTPQRHPSKPAPDDAEESEDEILLSPRKKLKSTYDPNAITTSLLSIKRTSSPFDDLCTPTHTQTPGPDRKRPRHADPPSDTENTLLQIHPTPSRLFSAPSLGGKTPPHSATPSPSSKNRILSLEFGTGDTTKLYNAVSTGDGSDRNLDLILPSSPARQADPRVNSPLPSRVETSQAPADDAGASAQPSANTGGDRTPVEVEMRYNEGMNVCSIPSDTPPPPFPPPPATPADIPTFTPLSPLTPLPPTPHPAATKIPRIPSNLQNNITAEATESEVGFKPHIEPPATALPPGKPPSVPASSNLPRSSSITQRIQPSSKVSSISLAKALGPKTAAKTFAAPGGGRATIAEMLGATVIPKSNKTDASDTSVVVPGQQKEKIKAKMKMKEKTNTSLFSFSVGGTTKVGVVTRSVPVKKWKGKANGGAGKFGSGSTGGTTRNATSLAGPSEANSAMPAKKSLSFSFAGPTASSIAKSSTNAANALVSSSTVNTKPTNPPTKASPVKQKSGSVHVPIDTPANSVFLSNSNSTSTTVSLTTKRPTGNVTSPTKSSLARAVSTILPATPSKSKYRPMVPPRGPTSLSTLASALEKLAMPPPPRPNTVAAARRPSTSMGFNRDLDEEGSDGMVAGRAADDGAIGRSSGSGVERDVIIGSESVNDPVPSAAVENGTENAVGPTTMVASTSSGPSGPTTSAGETTGEETSARSWMVVGSSRGLVRTGSAGAMKQRTLVGGGRRGIAGSMRLGMGRVALKVSRKTSLPSVMDSPVKGGGSVRDVEVDDDKEEVDVERCGQRRDEEVFMDTASEEIGTGTQMKEREKSKDTWKNVSWRASLASQALSQSLYALPPKTGPGLMDPPGTTAEKPADGGTADSQSNMPSAVSKTSGSVSHMGLRSSARLAMAGARSVPGALSKVKGGEGGHVSSGKKGAKEGSLGVMKDCTIFVDVRTDDGDDAGDLFVQMLKGLGARILTRVGQTCTHIVYKNGLASTLTRYRLLNEPRPVVVGIAWVVECVEQRKCVEADKFRIDLDGENVAGGNKRRRSMLPKHIPTTLESRPGDLGARSTLHGGDQSIDGSSSMMIDDDLPPLEKARMRRMMLGTQ